MEKIGLDDDSFRKILQFFNLSWRGYRRVRKGVKRRLAKHMEACGCRSMDEYLQFLEKNGRANRVAQELLTVSISRFFRDTRLWEVMENCVIPKTEKSTGTPGAQAVRAWSAGCSCGEEVYSLKILWHLLRGKNPHLPSLQILATDSNPEVLRKAQMAVYPQSSLKNLPSQVLDEAFFKEGKDFVLREEFKKGIHWKQHDFIREPPPAQSFHMIFLRNNLLTYYGHTLQTRSLWAILETLRPEGFLVIGQNETLPVEPDFLKTCIEYRFIFQKLRHNQQHGDPSTPGA